jgi:hypothetical protein
MKAFVVVFTEKLNIKNNIHSIEMVEEDNFWSISKDVFSYKD